MNKLKNVLITGAAGGFGTVTIDALLAEGYTVTGAMRDMEGRNKQAAETLKRKGLFVVEIDVTSDESVVEGTGKAAAQMGSIDILINNAGLGAGGIQEGFTADDYKKVFDVNVFGVQRMTRAVLPFMDRNLINGNEKEDRADPDRRRRAGRIPGRGAAGDRGDPVG